MDYNEEAELTRYVWRYFPHLFTEFEGRVSGALIAREKITATPVSSPVWRLLEERFGSAKNPEIDRALAMGLDEFRRRACRRVLAEHGRDVVINRCPLCRCVLRTPIAEQCFWCGHAWHRKTNPA